MESDKLRIVRTNQETWSGKHMMAQKIGTKPPNGTEIAPRQNIRLAEPTGKDAIELASKGMCSGQGGRWKIHKDTSLISEAQGNNSVTFRRDPSSEKALENRKWRR